MKQVTNINHWRTLLLAILVIVSSAWISGIIPRQIGKMTTVKYVTENHPEHELAFERVEFSEAHGDYFAVFKDTQGNEVNFLLSSYWLPTTILHDPLDVEG